MAELAEVQHQMANEARISDEAKRREIQSKLIQDRKVAAHKQLCARVVSKGFLERMMQSSLSVVEQLGYFEEDNQTQLYSNVLPWLYDEVYDRLDKYNIYSEAIQRMIGQIEGYNEEAHIQSIENKDRRIEKENDRLVNKQRQKALKREKKIRER